MKRGRCVFLHLSLDLKETAALCPAAFSAGLWTSHREEHRQNFVSGRASFGVRSVGSPPENMERRRCNLASTENDLPLLLFFFAAGLVCSY